MSKEDMRLAGTLAVICGILFLIVTFVSALVWLFVALWPTNPGAAVLVSLLVLGGASLIGGLNLQERAKK